VGDRYPSSLVPCGWGTAPPFIGQGGSSATELTVVLVNLAQVEASWRVLCSYRSGFEGGGVAIGRPATVHGLIRGCRQRGAVRGTVAVVVTFCPRALRHYQGCRHSTWRGAAVAGMAAQG
jgi:hypothetical protein